MSYDLLDRVYSIMIDVMTGVSAGSGNAVFYNTDSHTSFIELSITNGTQSFNMSEYNYQLVISKPDKTVYNNNYTTTDNSKLVIALDSDMLSGIGNNIAQLYVMKTINDVNKVVTMIEFNYTVKAGNYSALAPESVNQDSMYIALRTDVDSILSKIENGELGGGSGGTGLTATQAEQLATAYEHSQSPHITTADVSNAVSTYVTAHKEELKGAKGAKGDKGEKGDTGATGANGITPTLKVGSTSTGNAGTNASVTMTDSNNVYTLNFVIPKGDKGDTGAKGDAGAKGQDGAKGADGITPTLKVGTVTTLAAGSNATVTMSKNNNEYTLNFGIPKGNKGDTGASGGSGETTVVNPTITIGTVTNGDTASATITGDSPNYTLNLVLPKGDKGAKGDAGTKGADGITPTIAVGTTTTGEAGTNAGVTMSKSGTTYTFNFVIPKGAKGDTGAAGADGAKGEKGDPFTYADFTPEQLAALKGNKGDKGDKGDTGDKGEKGETGAKGDKGDPFTYADFTSEQLAALKGAKGDKGDKGDTGADGVAGAKGDKGDTGEKGADGVTPTFTIGTITTGAAGSTATVTITGTAPNYVLNFTIPKGDKGDTGEAGSGGDVDLTGYAKLTGATFTGKISSPIVSATRYFETPTLVGEGDDKTYYHRVVFGHRNFDKMEFHEYGGLFSFFKNQKGGANDGQLLFQISPSAVDSKVQLKENGVRVYSPNNKPTAADLGITTGTNGATFTPAVDDAGNLSWSNDKDLANPNTVNIKGDKGDKGDKGEKGDTGTKGADGQTPNISIGTVTTGAAGTNASATISGTTPNLTLNLTIPKGDKGDKGDTGAAGSGGTVTKTVKVLTSSAKVTLTTDEYQYLEGNRDMSLTLPTVSTSTDVTILHLFYVPNAARTLTFSDSTIHWQNSTPTIEANKYYEFIFTRTHKGAWLAGVVVYE